VLLMQIQPADMNCTQLFNSQLFLCTVMMQCSSPGLRGRYQRAWAA
jgi:hypothetical protein